MGRAWRLSLSGGHPDVTAGTPPASWRRYASQPLLAKRRQAAILTLSLFASYAYFYQAGGWNQNSRFDLVRAITNDGRLQIDPYQRNTGDKAIVGGHVYCDKAPGDAFAAVPFVLAARPILEAARIDPESAGGIAFLSYLATIATSGLATALAALCLYWIALRFSATSGGATFAATAFGLATPAWCYATLFIGHSLSAACLVFACAAAIALGHRGPGRRDLWLGAGVGFATGWATVTEYPAAVPAAILACLALVHAWPDGWRRIARVAGAIVVPALACATMLGAYNSAVFGSPFRIGYSYEPLFSDMKAGFFGLTHPKGDVLGEILFGQFRGLLPLAPVVAAAPVGLIVMMRSARTRSTAVAATLVALYYLLMNASFASWEGGWSYGPRYLSPALPFVCLGLAPVWTRSAPAVRILLVALWLYGAFFALVAVSTTAQPPAEFANPVREILWPAFRHGDLSLNTQSFTLSGAVLDRGLAEQVPGAAFNLGQLVGLSGLASLIPLAAIWAIALAFWGRTRRDRLAGVSLRMAHAGPTQAGRTTESAPEPARGGTARK